ncbi:MAG: DUF4340 domain-containing protein, partial [Polyangiaceae bacterium]
MIGKRSIYVHAGLVVTGAALALSVWTRDKQPKALVQSDITIWQGKPRDVESISFESKKKRVSLTAKKDDIGRYFTGTVTKDRTPPPPPGDAGAPEPAAESTVTTGVLSITPVEKLVDLLAPLKAIRTVGQVAADREAEFGLDDPEGTLTVKIGDAEKKLLIGGPTPGGGDRYARDPGTREVYVVKGDVFTKVDAADTALMERDLHEWKDAEVAGAKILAAGKERAVVRAGDGAKRFWADASSKDTPDETIANWMTKLERLRPTDFPE